MADNLKDFFISIGFAVDASGASRVEAAAAKTEAKITASNIAEAAKRIEADRKVNEAKIAAAAKTNAGTIAAAALTGKTLTDDEKKLVVEQDKLRQEQDKKARDRREKSLKEWQAASVKVAAVVTGIVTALEAVAVGVLYAADKAAQGFEQLHYSAQLAGTSAKGFNAFTYAAQQTGASVQEAGGSLDAFGKKLAKFPTYAEGLEKLGVKTKDANGHLLDSVDIATNLGDRLREIKDADPRYGLVNALNRSSVYGLDENTTRAIMNPEFRQRVSEYRKDHPSDDDAAKSGTDFEKSMRNFKSSVDGITTEFEDKVLKNLVPALDGMTEGVRKLSDYLHSKDFQDNLKSFEDEIGKISNAIKKVVSWITGANFDGSTSVDAQAWASHYDASDAHLDKAGFGRHPGGVRSDYDEARKAGKTDSFRKSGRANANANAMAMMDELKKAGLPDEGVAASLGSAQTESQFNPGAKNDVKGGHTGIIQWDSARWPKIKSWIESQGGDPWDVRWQTRAYIAEGRAKPGDALFDSERTQRGFAALEQSKGDIDKAVHGTYDIERFGAGEEGGRAANARAWLSKVQASPSAAPSKAPVLSNYMGKDGIITDEALARYNRDRGATTSDQPERLRQLTEAYDKAIDALNRSDKKMPLLPGDAALIADYRKKSRIADGVDVESRPSPFGALNPDAFKTRAPLGITPSVQSSIDNSRTRGDTNVTHNPTFTINGIQKPEEVASAVKFATSRSQSDLIRYMAGAVQ